MPWGCDSMVSRVLVPMDDSEMAEAALRFALSAFPSAAVTVLHVAGGPTSDMGEAMSLAVADDVDDAVVERAKPVFDHARKLPARATKISPPKSLSARRQRRSSTRPASSIWL